LNDLPTNVDDIVSILSACFWHFCANGHSNGVDHIPFQKRQLHWKFHAQRAQADDAGSADSKVALHLDSRVGHFQAVRSSDGWHYSVEPPKF